MTGTEGPSRGGPAADPVAGRTRAIDGYDVLGLPPRSDLVAVANLAARLCDVPLATVNLLTDTEQHQVATFGFDGSVCPVEEGLCAQILHEPAPVVVADLTQDARFRDHPMVNGDQGRIRFYASWRLDSREGVPIGTLCVHDYEPRVLDAAQLDALGMLADRVVDILELSLRSRELAATLAEVEAMRRQLERSNERLASFAGQVSHDLKTPLTSISLSLAVVREELPVGTDPGTLSLLDRAVSGSGRMAALIDDVLAYAQVGGTLRHDDVDLTRLVRDVRSDLGERLGGAVVDVGQLPVVRGDEVQLRAVLQNLLDNAAKYAHPERALSIVVRADTTATGWRVEVADNGRGVDPAAVERIFEPMTRASDAAVQGSGIGLATCRRVLAAHGGRIGLESPSGGGATAWFELPG